jgi:hypothetical protein
MAGDWDEVKTMDKIKEAQTNVIRVLSENSEKKRIHRPNFRRY